MKQKSTFRRILQRPAGAAGLIIIAFVVLVALFAPLIAPYDPVKQARGFELASPGADFWLGTDQFGRDILSRMIHGSRISLLVGLVSVGIGGSVGVLIGLFSGYNGGWIDNLIMRIFDVIMAYPALILGITIVAVIGTGSMNVAYALAIVYIPQFARVVRASVISQKEREYVTSAIAIGATDQRIIFKHVFPNCLGPILVQTSLSFGFAILAEASLSFLGLGTQPPAPSWGTMISEGRTYLRQAWWYPVFPGLALAFLSAGMNYFSDALRDALDPGRRNLA